MSSGPSVSGKNDFQGDELMSASSGLTVADASVAQSACYIGVSPGLFDEMGADGRMPQRINSRTVWDRCHP